MKSLTTIIIVSAVIISLSLYLCGCNSLMESVKNKSVNIETTVYGMDVTSADATAGGSPTGKFGFGTVRYRSIPMTQGQPFYVYEKISSVWSDASETTIWIGRTAAPSVLTFEAVPSTMIKIEGASVKSGKSSVTVTDSATGTTSSITPTDTNQPAATGDSGATAE